MKKKLIEDYQPDVIFVGDDWTPATFSGEGLGVPVVYLPHTDGISSTEIENVENLTRALEYAKRVIEAYDLEIMNNDMVPEGFCQGKIFKEALSDIERRRTGECKV